MNGRSLYLLNKLKSEFRLATGCTDPAAIASAVAHAKQRMKIKDVSHLSKIEVKLSPNVFKNGYSVDIPGTSEKGIPIAVALGFVIERTDLGFEIFSRLKQGDVEQAKQIISDNKVTVEQIEKGKELTIWVTIKTIEGDNIEVVVKKDYLNICLIKENDQIVYQVDDTEAGSLFKQELKIRDIVHFIETIPYEELSFVDYGINVNKAFVEEGIASPKGLKIGNILGDELNDSSKDPAMKIRTMTAAGVDARMGGSSLPVMSSAGSGNLGIGASIPLLVIGEHYSLSKDKLLRGIALTNLIHIYIKEITGRLTSICGGVLVGMGTSASIVWLLGGTIDQIEGAMKNVAANVTGMICDGANYGCSFKVSTTAVESYYAAMLALKDSIADSSVGIISESIEQTIKNVADVYLEMNKLDPTILKMISGN